MALWDSRYAAKEYVYGESPNDFLRENAHQLRGPVLCVAEGEGRNGVFLAEKGLEVVGMDASAVGLEKARKLAEKRGVSLKTVVNDLEDYQPPKAFFQSMVFIFAHFPSVVRRQHFPRLIDALLPGGTVLMEVYSHRQPLLGTGGPKDQDQLLTVDKVREEFAGLSFLHLQEVERSIVEGSLHTGKASVIQMIGRKN